MAIQIRPYVASDWESVCLIYDLAKPDELQGLVERSAILPLKADAGMNTLFQESEILVGTEAGTVVGFVGTCGNFITWLFVHPSHRRQGIAEQLLRHVVGQVQGAVTLNVAKLNLSAMRLYERLGFTIDREFASQFNGHAVQVAKLRYERVA